MSIENFKKYAPQKKYDKESVKHYHVKLNKITDADIIAKLESVESKNGYIRELLKKDLENK